MAAIDRSHRHKIAAPTAGTTSNYVQVNRQIIDERHYVLRSPGHPRRWVAFSTRKVSTLRGRWRDDFCLVIVGDSTLPDDFYAIPWRSVSHIFVDENVYPAAAKSGKVTKRWQIHLEGPAHTFQFELAREDAHQGSAVQFTIEPDNASPRR